MTTRTVNVWGKPYEIAVHMKSKTVWIATGQYVGSPVEGKGSAEGSAVKACVDAATYKGN